MTDRELLKKHFKLLMQAKEAGYISDEERAMMYEFARRGTVREEIDAKARQIASQGAPHLTNTGILKEHLKFSQDETARLSAEIEQARTILAGIEIGSLPNDYPLSKMALDMWNTLQERTLEGLVLIGKIEQLRSELDAITRQRDIALEWVDQP